MSWSVYVSKFVPCPEARYILNPSKPPRPQTFFGTDFGTDGPMKRGPQALALAQQHSLFLVPFTAHSLSPVYCCTTHKRVWKQRQTQCEIMQQLKLQKEYPKNNVLTRINVQNVAWMWLEGGVILTILLLQSRKYTNLKSNFDLSFLYWPLFCHYTNFKSYFWLDFNILKYVDKCHKMLK